MTELLLKIDKTITKRLILTILYLTSVYYIGIYANDITIYIMDNTIEFMNSSISVISIVLTIKGLIVSTSNDDKYMKWFISGFVLVLLALIINLIHYII